MWKTGQQILQHDFWNEKLIAARPVTVVVDNSEWLVLYSHPKTIYQDGRLRRRRSMPFQDVIDIYVNQKPRTLIEKHSGERHVLTITPPHEWFSVWLFWDAAWNFQNWFVNLQEPIKKKDHSIQITDYVLDIKVKPDRAWGWKDDDEFKELEKRVFYSPNVIKKVRSVADQMIAKIEAWDSPFCDNWENWRPHDSWPVPLLPDNWDEIEK